jgi:peptidoglycan/LPS O-acetylase OafA/YrhL
MRFLNWNHKKVQNLTPWEIWAFIAGRVFMSFGIGVLAMQYCPQMVSWSGVPTLVLGFVLLVVAARGLFRKSPTSN